MDPDCPPCTCVLQMLISAWAAGIALQNVQLVRVGIAERPQLAACDQHEVQREHGQMVSDPSRSLLDGSPDIAGALDRPRDEGEEALRVSIALDEGHALADLPLE